MPGAAATLGVLVAIALRGLLAIGCGWRPVLSRKPCAGMTDAPFTVFPPCLIQPMDDASLVTLAGGASVAVSSEPAHRMF